VELVERPTPQPTANRLPPHAAVKQLPPRNDAVLPLTEIGDEGIPGSMRQLAFYTPAN
jgi:hypothetical protein